MRIAASSSVMERSSRALAAIGVSAALVGGLGCGSAFLNAGDASGGDAGTSFVDGASDEGGTVKPPDQDDGGGLDSAADDTCAQAGATRACPSPKQIQTCTPKEGGSFAWSKCAPTDCAAPSPLPPGTSAACIAAGTFTMGGLSADAGVPETDTLPARSITLAHRFFLDQFEVTVGEFNTWWNDGSPARPKIGALVYVAGSGDLRRWTSADDTAIAAPGTGLNCTANANKPLASINCVTQATALAYCLSFGARLPTEAEWEYAASGQGAGNAYPWGANAPTAIEEESCLLTIDSVCANGTNGGQFPFPRPSATKGNTSAALGALNNLAGNVAEWTLDFAPSSGAACASGACWPSGIVDPWGNKDNGAGIVVRGGSFTSSADAVRTRARAYASATTPATPSAVGFRCVHTD
jgi:formylglycine-generating enzyme required for sulfatase activity